MLAAFTGLTQGVLLAGTSVYANQIKNQAGKIDGSEADTSGGVDDNTTISQIPENVQKIINDIQKGSDKNGESRSSAKKIGF
jgi:hypothetical protein